MDKLCLNKVLSVYMYITWRFFYVAGKHFEKLWNKLTNERKKINKQKNKNNDSDSQSDKVTFHICMQSLKLKA